MTLDSGSTRPPSPDAGALDPDAPGAPFAAPDAGTLLPVPPPQPATPPMPSPSAGAAGRPTAPPSGGHSRRIERAVAVVVILALGVFAIITYQNGQHWQDRAHTAEADAASLRRKLSASEADARSLQARVDALANEKADAQDQKAIAEQERNIATALANVAATAAGDLKSCRDALDNLWIATLDAFTYNTGLAYAQSLATAADNACNQADASYGRLVDAINAL